MKVTKKTVVSMYRQGTGWIVSNYEPSYKSWMTSGELSYTMACRLVKECRQTWDTTKQLYNI